MAADGRKKAADDDFKFICQSLHFAIENAGNQNNLALKINRIDRFQKLVN
jgi:hypothetical protein